MQEEKIVHKSLQVVMLNNRLWTRRDIYGQYDDTMMAIKHFVETRNPFMDVSFEPDCVLVMTMTSMTSCHDDICSHRVVYVTLRHHQQSLGNGKLKCNFPSERILQNVN